MSVVTIQVDRKLDITRVIKSAKPHQTEYCQRVGELDVWVCSPKPLSQQQLTTIHGAYLEDLS